METGDGALFVKNLAYFIRTHERALADAQVLPRQPRRHTFSSTANVTPTVPRPATSASNLSTNVDSKAAGSAGFASSSWLSSFGRSSLKPALLFLTPNQLYYLLTRFNELGVNTGPTNIRLESIHAAPSASSNYVSFLAQSQPPKIRSPDADSIHSVTSVRSFMSSMSSVLSHLSLSSSSTTRLAKQQAIAKEDVRYLYSAFTKVPCLKLSVDYRMKPISGFEEYPFDTAVPVTVFKNLMEFEVADIDFRSVYGWDILAENLRSLTAKRAGIDDLSDLLHDVVLDDIDQRRHRSSRLPVSPPLPLPTPSSTKQPGWPGSTSPVRSPPRQVRVISSDDLDKQVPPNQEGKKANRSVSPWNTPGRRKSSLYARPQIDGRRSSGSSASGSRTHTPRQSSNSLLVQTRLPSTKWRFLRHLSVVDCGLTSVSAESLLPLTESLKSLDLSSNLFAEIPEALASLTTLQRVKLSDCLIDSLRNLSRFSLPSVTVLNLRGNKLNSLAGIERLQALQRLDVRENRLTDPMEAARLTSMPAFCEIYVKRNPFTKSHSNYRVSIFNVFRATPGYSQDVCIDGAIPDRGERRQLVERAPLSVQKAGTDFVVNAALHPSLEVIAKDKKEDRPEQEANEPSRPMTPEHGAKQQRRKGPKRRVVEVADQLGTPEAQSESQPPMTTFVTAKETEDGASHHCLQKQTEDLETQGTSETSQTLSLKSSPNADGVSSRIGRPTLARTLSKSSETYRQKIEALKTQDGDAWLKTFDGRRARPDSNMSPFLRNPTQSDVFSPIKTASIASIKI